MPAYYDDPYYIEVLSSSLKAELKALPFAPDVIVASYHGMPQGRQKSLNRVGESLAPPAHVNPISSVSRRQSEICDRARALITAAAEVLRSHPFTITKYSALEPAFVPTATSLAA